MAQKRCKSRVYLVWTRIINELWAHIQRDHIQKWTRVVQTAIKQWNCEAKLQKITGNLPRRPQNILFFYLFLIIYYYFLLFLFFFYYFSIFPSFLCFLICFYLFLRFPIFLNVFKLFSVLEGNWISNFKYFLLCLNIFVYFLIASIICYNLVLFILILIYYLLTLFIIIYYFLFFQVWLWSLLIRLPVLIEERNGTNRITLIHYLSNYQINIPPGKLQVGQHLW